MAPNDGESRRPEQERARILAQLDRILNSPEFQAPDRGRRFFKYVVEEALEGRSEAINAYAIAQAVFGRGAGFDAQSDPVVRIEAGRIRRALERYYLVSGINDPVRITIPKGHYTPSFEGNGCDPEVNEPSTDASKMGQRARQNDGRITYRDLLVPVGVPAAFGVIAMLALIRPLDHYLQPSPAPPPATRGMMQVTTIVVEPLAVLGGMSGGTDIARGLRDQLIAQLTKLDGVVVLAPVVSEARLPAASVFSLQGNIASEKSSLHVQVRLIRSGDGSVVWAKRFDQQTQGRTVLDLQDEIGLQIVKDISTIGEINDKSVTK